MVACVACTKPVKADSKFCPHCGASQVQDAADAPQWVKVTEPQDTAPLPSSDLPARPAAPPDVPAEQTAAPVEPAPVSAPPELIPPLEHPVEPSASSAMSSASVTPTRARPDTRKPVFLWMTVAVVAVALAGSGAWYFGLFSGGVSEPAAEATQTASPPPETGVPAMEALPVEPPALLPEMAPIDEGTPAAREATGAPPAPKTQNQAAPSAPGDVRVQQKAPVRAAPPAATVQAQDAPAPVNVPKAESTKPSSPGAEPKPLAEANDPFAECRKISKYFERVICEEKARFKFCQGKWGTTPECPSNNFGE